MSDSDYAQKSASRIAKIPLTASIVAICGIIDAAYLVYHHYNAEPVPCGGEFDCETVLNSIYADIGGIPLAAFGLAAYFAAFALAVLAAFGNRKLWTLFGIQTTLMFLFTLRLIYLQYAVIHAWCQYCLLSAAITTTLFILYLASLLIRRRNTA